MGQDSRASSWTNKPVTWSRVTEITTPHRSICGHTMQAVADIDVHTMQAVAETLLIYCDRTHLHSCVSSDLIQFYNWNPGYEKKKQLYNLCILLLSSYMLRRCRLLQEAYTKISWKHAPWNQLPAEAPATLPYQILGSCDRASWT